MDSAMIIMFTIVLVLGSFLVGYMCRIIHEDNSNKQVKKIVKAINDDKEQKRRHEEEKQKDINKIVSAIQEERVNV